MNYHYTSPTMCFHYCDKLLASGDYTDRFGRPVISELSCRFPQGHDGPCANVEYRKIEYPSENSGK